MTTITLPRATVEQALEAMEFIDQALPWPAGKQAKDAITALRAVLAQQAEPKPMSPEQRQRWEELAAMPQQAEPVEPITRLFGTLPVHDAQQAEAAPFGCVTVRRLSLRHENHADQYQFYPAGQSPYLDNVDECHIVYTAPPKLVPLTDEEIVKIRISLPHFVSSAGGHPYEWAIRYARAVERALEEKNCGR